MVLLDFTKEELFNLIETFDHDNWLDYDDDGSLTRLRDKIWKYYEQENFVYVGNELLDEESSKSFLEDLKREPTQAELDYTKEADKYFRSVKTYTNGYCYKCKQEKKCNYFRDVCEECF